MFYVYCSHRTAGKFSEMMLLLHKLHFDVICKDENSYIKEIHYQI
jgi:hypothetical protein